ncbi:hypothetical protein MRB53_039456 [Persea americana]|nr:hypothetical protein MRB53_039456 [Persea americana]
MKERSILGAPIWSIGIRPASSASKNEAPEGQRSNCTRERKEQLAMVNQHQCDCVRSEVKVKAERPCAGPETCTPPRYAAPSIRMCSGQMVTLLFELSDKYRSQVSLRIELYKQIGRMDERFG